MSIDIYQIVLHQLIKSGEQAFDTIFRRESLEKTVDVIELMSNINHIYNTKPKGYGLFSANSEFAAQLKWHQSTESDFITFTQQSTQRLIDELIKYPFAEGGIVLFCHYRHLTTQYLMVAVLNSKDSSKVNNALDVTTTHYLDIEHIDIAARIDLTEWQVSPESTRYLTFLKGRVGRKIADFFMDYLDAEEGVNAKAQSQTLLNAVTDYCTRADLKPEEQHDYRQQVYHYCQGQIKAGEDVVVKQIAEALPWHNDQNFQQFVANNDYELDAQFPADKSTVRQLAKYTGSGGGVSVSFDSQLLGERVYWNEQSDTLTIKGLPPNFRDQLKRYSSTS